MAAPESVIEIGSTGVRLLIAEITADRQQNVLDRSDMPLSIGKDVFTSGVISLETQNQLIQILTRYAEQLAGWGISPEETSCFATSAFRDAKNSDPVRDRVLVQTGITIRIIDGIEETRLMYIAVSDCIKDSLDLKNDDTMILNVGGSTTEIMMISDGKMAGVHSIRLGTVRIEQQMRAIANSYDNMSRYVQESIINTKGTLDSDLNVSRVKQFIAVGNDVTLAAILMGTPVSTFLWEIKKSDFEQFVREVRDYSVEECVARFRISYSEAETLHVSLLIYNMFLKLTHAEKMYVPETNIRSGLLLSHVSNQNEKLQQEFDSQMISSAKNLLLKYHGDEKHAECVRMIAVKIYDALRKEIGLSSHPRILLEIAAILHDIGVFIRYDQHNLHSSYIIQNSEIFGLTRMDKTIVSEIAKYHKGTSMPQDEESFLMLPRAERMMILKLTAILRISDALDRGHVQKFADFDIQLEQDRLVIHSKKSQNTVLERMALTEKAEMFESVFGYKVLLE